MDETAAADPSDEQVSWVSRGFWTRTGSAFEFAAQRRLLGDTRVLKTTQSPIRIRGNHPRSEGTVHVGFLLQGRCDFGSETRPPLSLDAGEAFVVADWSHYDLTASEPTRVLNIRLSEARLRDRGLHLRHDRLRGVASSSLGPPLREFAAAIVDVSWRPGRPALAVAERAVEDLIVGMLLEATGYAMDSDELRIGLKERALAVIGERHRDASLDPLAVARHLGVSLRHLQRAFKDSGSTIAGSITRARSDTAALFLSSPRTGSLTLDELSARSGFASTFELRSAFKHHFKMLPSEYRNAQNSPRSHPLQTNSGL